MSTSFFPVYITCLADDVLQFVRSRHGGMGWSRLGNIGSPGALGIFLSDFTPQLCRMTPIIVNEMHMFL